MLKRTLVTAGGLAAIIGISVFAVGVTQGGSSVSAQETSTPAATGTAGTTSTPGPLTPVSTPTTGGAAGTSTAQLPATGTGESGGGTGSWAVLGLLIAAAGAGAIGYGMQRRAG